MDAIQFLKQEHQKARTAFEKLPEAPPSERGAVWTELGPELRQHEKIEEQCGASDPALSEWVSDRHQDEVHEVDGLVNEMESLEPEGERSTNSPRLAISLAARPAVRGGLAWAGPRASRRSPRGPRSARRDPPASPRRCWTRPRRRARDPAPDVGGEGDRGRLAPALPLHRAEVAGLRIALDHLERPGHRGLVGLARAEDMRPAEDRVQRRPQAAGRALLDARGSR